MSSSFRSITSSIAGNGIHRGILTRMAAHRFGLTEVRQAASNWVWPRGVGRRQPAKTRQRVALATGLPLSALERHSQFRSPDLQLHLNGVHRNIALDLQRIAAQLRCALPSRLRDLLEIAAAVYAADVAFQRTERADGVRLRAFLAPVRDLAFWRKEEPRLAESLYALCHDSYVFHFCRRTGPDTPLDPYVQPNAWEGTDCIALLSGGLDSFAGATALLASDRQPLFVVHHPENPAVLAAQDHVIKCLTTRFGSKVRWVAARCGPVQVSDAEQGESVLGSGKDPESTRAFLYLSLGAAACHATGARRLLCPENGLLALDPTLDTNGSSADRSQTGIQPRALVPFSQLMSAIGIPARLENPLLYQTKGQLVRDVLRPYFSPQEIQGSVSCWGAGTTSKPCGACIPCIVRAIAMRTSGLPREPHITDPLGTGAMTGLGSRARRNLRRLIATIRKLRSLDDEQLPRAYPALLDLPPDGSIRLAAGMLRHFANEAAEAIYS